MFQSEVDIAISKWQLAGMPTVSFGGRITVVDTHQGVIQAVEALRHEKMVGFDTETKPTFRKGQCNTVALIQMSTDSHSYLFRLNKMGLVDELKSLLEDERLIKIGLSLRDDFHVLRKICDFTPAGFIDLQALVHSYGIYDTSLQKIYAIIFGQRISKGQRLSNWEANQLTPGQQQYASIDAWACLKIYNHLKAGEFDPETSPYHQPQIIPAQHK